MTFAAVFLLALSGCGVPEAPREPRPEGSAKAVSAPEEIPGFTAVGVEVEVPVPDAGEPTAQEADQAVVSLQQQEMLTRAADKTQKAYADVEGLGQMVKQKRFDRLNMYALKYHWSPDEPPAKALERPEIAMWWSEWVQLRQDLYQAEAAAP